MKSFVALAAALVMLLASPLGSAAPDVLSGGVRMILIATPNTAASGRTEDR